jgi:predicted transposase YdaD
MLKGEQKRNIEIAVNLYNLGNSIEVIAKATGLTVEMVREAISSQEKISQ